MPGYHMFKGPIIHMRISKILRLYGDRLRM